MLTPKTIEAWLRGYVLFDVNGKRYGAYTAALAARKAVQRGPVVFKGLHIVKGWRAFYIRCEDVNG